MPPSNPSMQFSYQVCPIILTGGVATSIPGGMLPLINLVGAGGALLNPPLDPNKPTDYDNAFGAFNVLPGGTLLQMSIAKYPFANQDVAANATIREPLNVSVIMDAPMRGKNPWQTKQTVMSSLKATLDNHNNIGGTYTLATPAYIYENLVLVSLTDNSRGNNSLPQNAWRFDFERPLVALRDLQGSISSILAKAGLGAPVNSQSQQSRTPTDTTDQNAGLPPEQGGAPGRFIVQPGPQSSVIDYYMPNTFFSSAPPSVVIQIIPGFSMPQGVGLTAGDPPYRDIAIALPMPPTGDTQTRFSTAGTLVGGNVSRMVGGVTQDVVNFPAVPTPSSYAMAGIS